MRAMARAPDGQATLVEIKAVDAAYPLFGRSNARATRPAVRCIGRTRRRFWRARPIPTLMARLEIKPGRTAHRRQRHVRNPRRADKRARQARGRHRLWPAPAGQPGRAAREPAVAAGQPGALALSCAAARQQCVRRRRKGRRAQARAQLPEAGWEIRSRSNASPQLERNVERFTQFLTIVGLTALLVGGVGVGNAVKSHLDRRRDTSPP